jgi:hypothetical protein
VEALLGTSCECYRTVKARHAHLLE